MTRKPGRGAGALLGAHGLLFVALQAVVALARALVVALGPLRRRVSGGWSDGRFALLPGRFSVWSLLLGTLPLERGADPFSYTLGSFDGFSLAGLLLLLFVHAPGVDASWRKVSFGMGKTI